VPVQHVRPLRHPIQATSVSGRRHRSGRIRALRIALGEVGLRARAARRLLWYRPRAATSGGPLNAHEALDDLKQISVQVTAAAIGSSSGALEAATLSDPIAGERLVRLGAELWEAAEQARRDLGRDELSQVEVATPEGSVFVLRDAVRTIVATTTVDPIVGLVFYDLRTCLRTVAEGSRDVADTGETSQNGPGEGFDGAA
jgi:predicted regulator of Ras-like GTPase activity (Roadblock/LC7/MglB family)